MMNNTDEIEKIPNGIEICEDKCRCGGNLRLHTHTFRFKNKQPNTMHYIDCDRSCGCVSNWYDSIDHAIEAFDAEFSEVC